MAALTAHKQRKFERPGTGVTIYLDVPALTKIFAGAIVVKNASGQGINPIGTDGADFFVGISVDGFDNSANALATTTKPLRVEYGAIESLVIAAAVAVDIRKLVYATDSALVTLTAGTAAIVGRIARIVSSTEVMIDTQYRA